jgi:hypothetical protein
MPGMKILRNSHMLVRFGVKFMLLLILVSAIDFILGSAVEYLYFHQGNNWYTATTYVVNEAEEDILIFGSSRANHHYIPEILTDATGLSCYNAGCDGQSLFYDYALFRSVLSRRKPEKVILDLGRTSLYHDPANYDRLSHLYPYYGNNEGLSQVVDLKGRSGRLSRLSKLYTYNSTMLVILKSFVRPRTDFQGYIPYPGDPTMDPAAVSYDSLWLGVYDESIRGMRIDENKVDILNSFIEDALEAEVDLYVIDSPYFYLQKDSNNISLSTIRNILAEHNLTYYNFANNDAFTLQTGLFGDDTHMNHFGAEKFTRIVAGIIKD